MHYSCEQQLQYYTVLSKPGTSAASATSSGSGEVKGKKEKVTAKSQTPPDVKYTLPKFYNVRPVVVVGESQPQPEIDEEVCAITL